MRVGNLIHNKEFLNENVFLYEDRLTSQYSIFLDGKSPTYVTYYHINNVNSITDSGLLNVERILGEDSPIRFQQIENFPIYGIETMKMDLSEEEEGLTVSYDSEGTILPGTIEPLPNDLFVVSYLGNDYLFMVTSVEYGTIKSNNYWKISYTLKSANHSEEIISSQILEKYNCIMDNIGTQDRCLVRSDIYEKIENLKSWYKKIMRDYVITFYVKRYNSFMFDSGPIWIYDKYLTNFIHSNRLFVDDQNYKVMALSNEDYSNTFHIQYENCIYRKIEEKDKAALNPIRHLEWSISYPDSIFNYYKCNNVRSVFIIPTGEFEYLPDDLIGHIQNNELYEDNILFNILIKYFNNDLNDIDKIDINALNAYRLSYDVTTFRMIPIALYCIRYAINKYMKLDRDKFLQYKGAEM